MNTTPARPATIAPATASGIDWKSWAILIILSLIWGTSYILIKRGLEVFSPTQVASLRLSLSSIAFIPILLYRLKRVDWSRWKPLLLVGLLGSGFPAFLFSLAQTQISSSMAGMLNSLTPLFTLLLGILFFGLKAAGSKALGVLLGLAGATALILLGNDASMGGNAWFGLLVVMGALCYAGSSNIVGAYLRDMSSITISAVAFAMIGLPAMAYLLSTDFMPILAHREGAWAALGYIAALSLFSTVLASVIFFRLVQSTSPVFASMISYLVPIVALAWGAFDGEPIALIHFLGMGLIMSGIYLVKK